jgi:hypothetical protein
VETERKKRLKSVSKGETTTQQHKNQSAGQITILSIRPSAVGLVLFGWIARRRVGIQMLLKVRPELAKVEPVVRRLAFHAEVVMPELGFLDQKEKEQKVRRK